MLSPRLAARLVAFAGACGAPEALVGDVLEEIDSGRSLLWVCQQLVGLYVFAVIRRVYAIAHV